MDKIQKEYERLHETYKQAGADDLKLEICENLIMECARAKVQLDNLNDIVKVTGLVKVHPKQLDIQKPLPVATEITKIRASLTNMTFKLTNMLCELNDDDDLGLDEYE